MEELTERIEEASGATQAQIELNKKRESEVIEIEIFFFYINNLKNHIENQLVILYPCTQ